MAGILAEPARTGSSAAGPLSPEVPHAGRFKGQARRHRRGQPHSVRPRPRRLRPGRQPGNADGQLEGAGRPFRAARRGHGRRDRGRGDEALQPVEPRARVRARVRPGARDARPGPPARLRHQPGSSDPRGQQDCAGPDGLRHRRRRGHGLRRADRLWTRVPAAAAGELPRQVPRRAGEALARTAAAPFQAGAARCGGAADRPVHGPELRADGPRLEGRPGRAGPARLREPPPRGSCLRRGVLRRPRGPVRRVGAGQQPAP